MRFLQYTIVCHGLNENTLQCTNFFYIQKKPITYEKNIPVWHIYMQFSLKDVDLTLPVT